MNGQVHIDIDIAAQILEELMDALEKGEMTSIILTREGKPAAKLILPSSGSGSTRNSSSFGANLSPSSTFLANTGGTDHSNVGTASDRKRAP